VVNVAHAAIKGGTMTVILRAKTDGISHRTAAMAIGVEKVRAAKTTRGLFP
jgi:glutamate dehydrogenase (NAD(P)+)